MKTTTLIGITCALLAACSNAEEVYIVQEKLINEGVYASGEILPAEFDILKSTQPDRILKIMVEEGQTVSNGETLIILGSENEQQQLLLLQRQLEIARQNLNEEEALFGEIKGKIRLAETQFLHDSIEAVKNRELATEKAVSQREADQSVLQAATSSAHYHNLQRQYESLRRELENEVLQREKDLAQFQHTRQGKELKSKISGKVFSIYRREGELPQALEPLAMVGSESRFKLELLIDERDIALVRPGQKVVFETDPFPESQFEATVSRINPVLQKETRSFMVEALIDGSHDFFPQSTAEATIIIREKTPALVIPNDYLLEGDSVIVETVDGRVSQKVRTGIKTGEWVEIKSGLSLNEGILKPKGK